MRAGEVKGWWGSRDVGGGDQGGSVGQGGGVMGNGMVKGLRWWG